MQELILEVKKKREFSGLPDSIIKKVLIRNKGDVKESRKDLRKYFGVFLTNRVLKGKGTPEELLKSHLSSKKRDYDFLYSEIKKQIKEIPKTIIDLGAGVNGYSVQKLKEVFGEVSYVGIDASKQLVDNLNSYFEEAGFSKSSHMVWHDLFEIEEIKRIIQETNGPHLVFMFQLIDALENIRRDFSKDFIYEIMKHVDFAVITLPTESLGGKKKFFVKRNWIVDFIEEHYKILKDFEANGERVLIMGKKEYGSVVKNLRIA